MRYKCRCNPLLPINAFKPKFGAVAPFSYGMTLEGGGGCIVSGIVCSVSSAVSDVGCAIGSAVSDVGCAIGSAASDVGCWICQGAQAVGDAGASICSAVQCAVPGGWGTIGAAALAVATDGASLGLCAAIDTMGPTYAELGYIPDISSSIGAMGPTYAEMGYIPEMGPTYSELGYDPSLVSDASSAIGAPAADTTYASTISNLPSGGDTLTDPSLTTKIGDLSGTTKSANAFNTLDASLGGSGAVPGAASLTLPEGGLSGALPQGVAVGDGSLGTTFGKTYMALSDGSFALDAFGNPIEASSIGICGFAPESGLLCNLHMPSLPLGSLLPLAGLLGKGAKAALCSGSKGGASATKLPTTTKSTSGANLGGIAAPPPVMIHGQQIALPEKAVTAALEPMPAAYMSGQSGADIKNAASGGSISNNQSSSSSSTAGPTSTYITGKQITLPWQASSTNVPLEANPAMSYSTANQGVSSIQSAAEGGEIQHMAAGGYPDSPGLRHGKGFSFYSPAMGLNPLSGGPVIMAHAEGGEIIDHQPEFFSEGGAQHFVKGGGTGTSDSVPAMLANGEFVIPADVVASLGDGSNDSGSKILDEFLQTVRKHKQSHDAKHLPPDSKGPLGYLLEAKKKVKK